LPEIAKNCNGKRFVDTDGKHVRENKREAKPLRGRLDCAFVMCVSMSDKPFDAEACDIGGQASATNGLTDATNGLSDMKNALCNRPLKEQRKESG
jgi:hypothetical protein